MFDLLAELPRLLPAATAWAEARSGEILAQGEPLSDIGVRLARAVGVAQPGRVRILEVTAIPLPDDPHLRLAARETGLLGPHVAGLTLGHGIYLVKGHRSNRLVSHECRHVFQYETAGSIAAFLPNYLQQIATVGYEMAPLEVDARAHERDVA